MRTAACCLLAGLLGAAGFTAPGAIPARHGANRVAAPQLVARPGRRDALAAVLLAVSALPPHAAWASGGATAGKYTTIPIAKRRYFGRVKQGVYKFMGIAAALKAGDLDAPQITDFFSISHDLPRARARGAWVLFFTHFLAPAALLYPLA